MKNLSEKTLRKRYLKALINEKESILLHKYMLCFSNLYGCVQIKDLWNIFKQYKEKISKEKFINFIDIAQKEDNNFLIVNLNEAYTGETSKETEDKLLLNKLLVREFRSKYWYVYRLNEAEDYAHGPYVLDKEELFKFDHDIFYESAEGKEIVDYLSKLKTSGYEYNTFSKEKRLLTDLNGNSVEGKYLKDAVCYTHFEKFDIDYYKNENEKEYLKKEFGISCLQKILNKIKTETLIESVKSPLDSTKRIMNYMLNELGTEISEDELNGFIGLYTNLVNSSNRWCMFGWSSNDLRKTMPLSEGPVELQIGPNMQKMIDEGKLDIKELDKVIKDKNMNVTIANSDKKHNYSFEELEKENNKHLETFRIFLEGRNYRENIIEQHLNRVDYYINDYLMYGLPKPMQEGCSLEFLGFIENFVNERVIPASVHNIDFFLTSISLFYECMRENGLVSKEAYSIFRDDARNLKDEMIEDYYDKNPKEIDIYDVIEAIEEAHGFGDGYINLKTGERAYIPEDESFYDGYIDELYNKIEGQFWEKVPEVNDYQIMVSFSLSLKDKKQSDKLIGILHKRRSYRNFKDAIYEMDIEDKYYDFYESEIENIAANWLSDNNLDNSEEDYDENSQIS